MKPAAMHFTGPNTVCWKAPGDDWKVGTAASYELRAFPRGVSAKNFTTKGTLLPGAPAPAVAGTEQCATVSTTGARNIGLRAIDDAGNISFPAKAHVPH